MTETSLNPTNSQDMWVDSHKSKEASETAISTPVYSEEKEQEVCNNAAEFCSSNISQDESEIEVFRRAAILTLVSSNDSSNSIPETGYAFQPTEAEVEALVREKEHPWTQPPALYLVTTVCAVAAAVQGMDETVINGAQLFFPHEFGIYGDDWLLGLCNCAPYLCCAVLGCWLAPVFANRLGRKKAIWLGALAVTNSWEHLFVARFFLGVGIGINSATVPVYSAESAPTRIRGSLVMTWQMFTAFGIMLGYVSSLAFQNVTNHRIHGLQWRLMLGSALIPALVVCVLIPLCPESPRWLVTHGKHDEAYKCLQRLRETPLQAARDLLLMRDGIEMERVRNGSRDNTGGWRDVYHKVKSFVVVRRNRNAAIASWLVMFGQQFCGINVIAYYSSSIFVESGFSTSNALLASWGFGMINFLFALPAFYTIDTFGRRSLLLVTYPPMALCTLLAGLGFLIPESNKQAHVGVIALGIYLFSAIYSSGPGPVPFTYSAEVFPFDIRSIGMSFATATCWFFNFVLSLTWPSLKTSFTPTGAFGYYAAWNLVLWVASYFFIPETKNISLENLEEVFNVPLKVMVRYRLTYLEGLFIKSRRNKEVPTCPA